VAVEGTDAADGAQRALAYVVGRPGRALVYLAVMTALGAGVAWVSLIVIEQATLLAMTAGFPRAEFASESRAAGWWLAGSMWAYGVCFGLVLSWIVSYMNTAGTLMYLALRRVNDQQDVSEVWMPGMVGGTLAAEVGPAASGA
jgi:hypothetical protein